MKIEMEKANAYQIRKIEENKPSSIKWVMIIALGVFLGNAASFSLERAVLYWELRQVAIAASAAMEQTSRNFAESRKAQEVRNAQQQVIFSEQQKQRQIKQQNKQAGYKQAKETCDFWNQQIRTENTERNRMFRDQACNLVNQFR